MSVLQEFHSQYPGFTVRLKPNMNLGVRPIQRLSDEARAFLVEHKQQIIEELQAAPPVPPPQPKPMPLQQPVTQEQPTVKVGKRLRSIIDRTIPESLLSLVPKATCGCSDYEKKMDKWGIDGCIKREEEILNHLVKQSETMGLVVKAVPKLVRRKVAKRMFDIAVKRR